MTRNTTVARSVRAFLFLVSLAIAANSPTALAAQSVKAYVANYGANTVSVINTTTNAVAAVVTARQQSARRCNQTGRKCGLRHQLHFQHHFGDCADFEHRRSNNCRIGRTFWNYF